MMGERSRAGAGDLEVAVCCGERGSDGSGRFDRSFLGMFSVVLTEHVLALNHDDAVNVDWMPESVQWLLAHLHS